MIAAASSGANCPAATEMTISSAGSVPGKAKTEIRIVDQILILFGPSRSSGALRRYRQVTSSRSDLPNPAPALPRRLATCEARLPVRYRTGCHGAGRRKARAGRTQRRISLAAVHRLRKSQHRSRCQNRPRRPSRPRLDGRLTHSGNSAAPADRGAVRAKEATGVPPPVRGAEAAETRAAHAASLSRADCREQLHARHSKDSDENKAQPFSSCEGAPGSCATFGGRRSWPQSSLLQP